MKIQPFGDSALLITFKQVISEEVNQKVISLYKSLIGTEGFVSLIPAYNSLTISFNKRIWSFNSANTLVRDVLDKLSQQNPPLPSVTYSIPVCYNKSYGPDLLEVSRHTGLSEAKIIELHTSHTYRVYMLGFVAGFAYMGSLPRQLKCKRKSTPRMRVPQGAIGLAGIQTGIYPTEAPGGWQIIGRTPLNMFDPHRLKTSLLQPGDSVRFRSIEENEFKIIQLKIETGIFEMEVIDE